MQSLNSHSRINEIDADHWNQVCGTDYPFLRHEFLNALEQTECVTDDTGWFPCHLSLKEGEEVIGYMPLYLKTHSYGEYVFDWAWADAYHRHGLEYYPKLINAIPFTPCYGPRIGHTRPLAELIPVFNQGLKQLTEQFNCSSYHILFPCEEIKTLFSEQRMLCRMDAQYHWFNRDYQSFDHYLDNLNSRKRKSIRKERQKALQQDIELITLEGNEISDQQLKDFYQFYQLTYLKRGRQGYLTLEFFQQLLATMPEQMVLVLAKQQRAVAGALFFKSSDTLYGRYWGCRDEFDSLHFETCYYQGIDYCIKHGLKRFDPGAQGEHKIQRGFKPIKTWSTHWLSEPGFHQAVDDFLKQERQLMVTRITQLREKLPYKSSD